MKTLYMIGGPMGVGKTTVSRALLARLPHCAFLDGDWCWTMQPFTVTAETRAMVMDNITHVLSRFLQCSEFENIVFCWVMHQQRILDELLSGLPLTDVRIVSISLVAPPDALAKRIRQDIAAGLRDQQAIGRALAYLPLYETLHTVKVDTGTFTPEETAEQILKIGEMNE